MKLGRKRSGAVSGFFCFGAELSDVEAEVKPCKGDVSPDDGSRRPRRLPLRRILTKIFRSSSQSRSEKGSNRSSSSERMGLYMQYEKSVAKLSRQSTEVDEGRSSTNTIFTSSSDASSLSSSSSSTSSSSATLAVAAAATVASTEPTPPERRAQLRQPPPIAARTMRSSSAGKCGQVTGIVFLLMSLSMLVLCGRVGAIVWTSALLCYIACRNYCGRPAEVRKSTSSVAAAATSEIRRRGSEGGEERKKRVVLEGLLQRSRKV